MKKIKMFLVLLLLVSLAIIVGCSKPKYNVSFETDCEQTIASQEIIENEKVIKPTDPVKEGYSFIGWFNGDEEYNFDNVVTSELKLQAKWEICNYIVSFDTGTNEKIDPQKVEYNKKVTKPDDPVKEGYVFNGWFKDNVRYDFESVVKEAFTLVAKWKDIPTRYITFIAEGEVIDIIEVKEGKDVTPPTAPSIEGKVFVKWDGDYTNVTEDRDVVAVYESIKFKVEFKVDGTLYKEVEVEYGSDCVAPDDPVKEGYKFIGWDIEFKSVKSDLVVNAKFTSEQFKIQYFSGNHEITDLTPSLYTPEQTVILGEITLDGYYFYGWYDNSEFLGEPINIIEKGTTGDLKLYALNVKKDNNGGLDLWETNFPDSHDPSKGINEISNLPEQFEMDFYKYLLDNNLLNDPSIDLTCQASSWAVFSGVNPIHNGDPQRIWNDTSSNASGSANGYVSVFLYDTILLNTDLTVIDVQGGFLGTEPYKTKYRGLLDALMIMYQYKVENSNYSDISANTNASRALLGFVIDGYFYGTQGAGSGYLKEIRSVIPGIDYSYKLSGTSIEKINYNSSKLTAPVRDGYVFAGWYLDKDCTKSLKDNAPKDLCTLYAKWEELK